MRETGQTGLFGDIPVNDQQPQPIIDDGSQKRATEIIKPLIPSDAKERVERTFKQWNLVLRDHIRSETALKLSDSDGKYSIPVRIVNGFPNELAQLINRYQDPVLWKLVLGQPKLGGIVEGLQFLLKNWKDLEDWPTLPDIAVGMQPCLQDTLEIVNALQLVAAAEEIREQIESIDEDILGAYFYPKDKRYRIDLYWIPIAMTAAMLDVEIEHLAVVVLTHELAHGYSHQGRDIEGTCWDDNTFAQADKRIKEGLAQYYTNVVMEKLAERSPGPKIAFDKLLKLQGEPYRVHLDWLDGDSNQKGEAVRFTLVAARKQKAISYNQWLTLLNESDISLGRNVFD